MTRSEKIKATITKKYMLLYPGMNEDEAYQKYVDQRYKNPKAIEDQKRAASAGGKASGQRTYTDHKKARESYEKGLGKKRGIS